MTPDIEPDPLEVLARMTRTEIRYSDGLPVVVPKDSHGNDDPLMSEGIAGVHESVGEFGGTAQAIRSFKKAILPALHFSDDSFRNRAACLFNDIMRVSPGPPGLRSVALSQFPSLAENFELSMDFPFYLFCMSEFESIFSPHDNTVSVETVIDIPEMLQTEGGATHFRLLHALGIMSDIIYDPKADRYVSAAPDVDGVHAVTQSDIFAMDTDAPIPIAMQTTLPVEFIPDSATVLELIGIEFYGKDEEMFDEIGYELYYGGMKILNAY